MRLVAASQALASATSLSAVTQIACRSARSLADASAAAVCLMANLQCTYVDEDLGSANEGTAFARRPLFTREGLSLDTSVVRDAVRRDVTIVIDDLDDQPIADLGPSHAMRSVLIAPLRAPGRGPALGALVTCWSRLGGPTDADRELLQALAESAAIAIANVDRVASLEALVAARTRAAEAATTELEQLAYAVSHDLRAPLRAISGFAQAVIEDASERLDEDSRGNLQRVTAAASRMSGLIDDLLELSRVTRSPLVREPLDVSAITRDLVGEKSARGVTVHIAEGLSVVADRHLFRSLMECLLDNAFKFTARAEAPHIEIGATGSKSGDSVELYVQDNGVGFDMRRVDRLFTPFQRLVSPADFPGRGIGLARAKRIVRLHGGDIAAEGELGRGARFVFRLAPP